jgi:hypothetical protein
MVIPSETRPVTYAVGIDSTSASAISARLNFEKNFIELFIDAKQFTPP